MVFKLSKSAMNKEYAYLDEGGTVGVFSLEMVFCIRSNP
jgi:hypothetical protein